MIHSTLPVSRIMNKLDLLPQDLATEKVTPVSYELMLGSTVTILALIMLVVLTIACCKRRVQHGRGCFFCGS